MLLYNNVKSNQTNELSEKALVIKILAAINPTIFDFIAREMCVYAMSIKLHVYLIFLLQLF